jgi:hypothetical protein
LEPSSPAKDLARRGVIAFSIGVAVCLLYWASGFIPREWWFASDNRISEQLIVGKFWLWPTALLAPIFAPGNESYGVSAIYVLNGVTYAFVGVTLMAVRNAPAIYVLVVLATLAALGWFNAVVMETFSWLWLILVTALLTLTAVSDLRREGRRDDV